MATWIAHLRLAENLLERIPNLDAAQFAIGNLAPDSGVPDEKWENFDPPKEVTHFLHNGTSESHIHDLLYISPLDVPRFSLQRAIQRAITPPPYDGAQNDLRGKFL